MITIDYKILETLKTNNTSKKNSISNTMSESQCLKVFNHLRENYKDPINETTLSILITGLLQSGGSNKNAGNSVSYHFSDTDGEHTLTASQLLNAIKKVDKKATPRQYAKGVASMVAELATFFEIEGDLASQMKLTHPDLSVQDAVWCSNFQTHNPNCPHMVRNWLVENYKSRFKS